MELASLQTHQLGADTVCSFEGPRVEEIVVAPVAVFLLLLVRVVRIQQCQVIACIPDSRPVRQ